MDTMNPTVARLLNTNQPIRITDQVPAHLRQKWGSEGPYENLDLFQSFAKFVKQDPTARAIVDETTSYSYQDLYDKSLSLAGFLNDLGIKKGDVIAINLANSWQACAADLAVAALGAIALPYPVGRKHRETLLLLKQAQAKAIICEPFVGETDYEALLEGIRSDLPSLKHILIKGIPQHSNINLADTWTHTAYDFQPQNLHANEPVRIIASSGTESAPKLVLYSHNSLVGGQASYLKTLGAEVRSMRALFCVSLASPFGSLGTSCILAAFGGTLVTQNRFSPETTLTQISNNHVTHVFCGPNMVDMLLAAQQASSTTPECEALCGFISGGAPLSAQTAYSVKQIFGCSLIQSYGSADGIACHTGLNDDIDTTVETVGLPDPDVIDIKIVDENEQPLPHNTEGEILALGPMTPMCYYNAPELDAKYRTQNGWVRTGDKAMLDEQGRLKIMGRRNDTLLRNGIKINRVELEMLIREYPNVSEVAVVEYQKSNGSSLLSACVVPSPGYAAPSKDQINHFLLKDLGVERYKLIDNALSFANLPLAPSGKVDLKRLTSQAQLTPDEQQEISAKEILDLLMGVERAGVLRAAIELKVFDLLEAGETQTSGLAQAAQTDLRGMRILLAALAGLGLIEESNAQVYRLTKTAKRHLVSTSPYYVGGLSQVYTADLMWEAFKHFKDCVISGKSLLSQSLEADDHTYWQEFAQGIANTSRVTAKRMAEMIAPLVRHQPKISILDMACGNGIYGFTLTSELENASLTSIDWPTTQPVWQKTAAQFGLSQRAEFIGENLFKTTPGAKKYDVIILSQILHHFDLKSCQQLIKLASDQLNAEGQIIVLDFMLSDQLSATEEAVPRLFGSQMLALTEDGECYPVNTIKKLLSEQGLQLRSAQQFKGLPVHYVLAQNTQSVLDKC